MSRTRRPKASEIARADVHAVLSGSYRRAPERLKVEFEQLEAVGFKILSPANATPSREREGCVFMKGEEAAAREVLEERHLERIRRAHFVWLHAPDGYVGVMGALEIGFAIATEVPIYAREAPADPALRPFVHLVSGPEVVWALIEKDLVHD